MSGTHALEKLASAPFDAPSDLLDFERESLVFRRIRAKAAITSLLQAISASRLRAFLVAITTGAFWVGLFLLFQEGFVFLRATIDMDSFHEQAIHVIYSVFFASLMIMLLVSTGILMYGGLYRSRDTELLLTLPVHPERIVLNKFQESLALGSWGFLLLGSPMLIAYGVVADAPWYYYALIVPYMVAFVTIPGGLGALACLVLVTHLATLRRHAVGGLALLTLLVAVFAVRQLFADPDGQLLTPAWIHDIVNRLRFSEHRLLPSWWLSTGLLAAADGNRSPEAWSQSVLFLSLLVANALACHQLVLFVGGRYLRKSFSRLLTAPSSRKRVTRTLFDTLILRAPFFLPWSIRVLLIKDLRGFRRDPAQWTQFLIFVGLLGLYFVNIRRFQYAEGQAAWIHMISLLNLSVVGMILATFTTRFVFPLISLEGRRFWILGLLPVSRDTILWGKYAFALLGTAIPSAALVWTSDFMLGMPTYVMAAHQGTCLLFCLGLSGIAVGLGAALPDLRETNPSRIAAGFGGTLNLVLSTAYIIIVTTTTGIPIHVWANLRGSATLRVPFAPWVSSISPLGWCVAGWVVAILSCLAVTFWIMRRGLRRFRVLEA